MAELILTDEEREAPLFIDWTDEALGKAVRDIANKLSMHSQQGYKGIPTVGAAFWLITCCLESNADRLAMRFDGHTRRGVPTGDWEITVTRVTDEDNP